MMYFAVSFCFCFYDAILFVNCYFPCYWSHSQKVLTYVWISKCFFLFSISSFIISGFILSHWSLLNRFFFQGERYGSNFKPQQMEIHFSSTAGWKGLSVFSSLFSKPINMDSHCYPCCIGNRLGNKRVLPKGREKTHSECGQHHGLWFQTGLEDSWLWIQCDQLPHASAVLTALPWWTVLSSCDPK